MIPGMYVLCNRNKECLGGKNWKIAYVTVKSELSFYQLQKNRKVTEYDNFLKKLISAQFQFYFLRVEWEWDSAIDCLVFTSLQCNGGKCIYLNNQPDSFGRASMGKEKLFSTHRWKMSSLISPPYPWPNVLLSSNFPPLTANADANTVMNFILSTLVTKFQ